MNLHSPAPSAQVVSATPSQLFLNIPAYIATHPGLHRAAAAKLVYGALRQHCRHRDRCRVRWETLALECDISRATVARSLALLEGLGLIQRLAVWVDGTRGRNRDRAANYYILLPLSTDTFSPSNCNINNRCLPSHDDTTPSHDETPVTEAFEQKREETTTPTPAGSVVAINPQVQEPAPKPTAKTPTAARKTSKPARATTQADAMDHPELTDDERLGASLLDRSEGAAILCHLQDQGYAPASLSQWRTLFGYAGGFLGINGLRTIAALVAAKLGAGLPLANPGGFISQAIMRGWDCRDSLAALRGQGAAAAAAEGSAYRRAAG